MSLLVLPFCAYLWLVSAAQFPSRSQGRQASSTASSSSINASQQMSAGASGNSEVAAEMQALIAQNEELKASLLQMRKRNAQVWNHGNISENI